MKTMLEEIKDCLKDTHIDDGTNQAFDATCEELANRFSQSVIFTYGEKKGREDIQETMKEILNIKE